ncbi:beta-xylosidase XylA, partial [Aspergillus fischeri NRRL 181]
MQKSDHHQWPSNLRFGSKKGWCLHVMTADAWNISYKAAVEGIVLLKNDGTLPLAKSVRSVALIGPWMMGGGQVDSSSLKSNKNTIITGKRAPAGRLVVTQYPAEYATQFPATDMNLRPLGNNPGQTYMWYTGTPVYEFGHGLFYTTFSASLTGTGKNKTSFNIQDLLTQPHPGFANVEQMPFLNFTVKIANTGKVASDYTAMLFANTTAGPAPYPNKWLVGFDRLSRLGPHSSKTMTIPVTIDSVARTDEAGNRVLYPGKYELALNNERSVVLRFGLTGREAVIFRWPVEEQQISSA